MTDNLKREHFYFVMFISTVILLNDLMKILVGLGIINRVIFKDFGSNCNWKIVLVNKQTNFYWYKYKLNNIVIGQYHIYRKQMKKKLFFQKWGLSVEQKRLLIEKSEVIFRFNALKLVLK